MLYKWEKAKTRKLLLHLKSAPMATKECQLCPTSTVLWEAILKPELKNTYFE